MNLRRARFQDAPRAPRLQPRLRFRGHQPHDLLRPVPPRQLVLRRHRACLLRAAAGQGARDTGRPARQGAGGGLHRAVPEPGERLAREGAGEPPGGPAAAERGRLRAQEPAARRQEDRRALRGRVPRLRHEPRALRHALCPGARADRHHDVDPHRRRGAVPEPAAQLRLRRDHRYLGRRGCRRGTSSASSGAPRPPTGRARATPPASRTRASTR